MSAHVYTRHPAIPSTADIGVLTTEDPCLSADGVRVAYYRSEEHRAIDRRTVSPLHRYLTRNLGLSEADATEINDGWNRAVAMRQADTSTCRIVDGAEMVRLMCLAAEYLHCPSCMTDDGWTIHNHPRP